MATAVSIMWKTKRFYVIVATIFGLIAAYIFVRTGTSNHHSQQLSPNANQVQRKDVDNVDDSAIIAGSREETVAQVSLEHKSASKPLLKILVLTYKRADSLARCLASLNAAQYDGEHVMVEIHVDRGRDEQVDNKTVHTATSFVFEHGLVHVYVRPRHVGVLGQWLSSWRVPRDNTSEIAVFIEDDITVSPFFARWLRRVHEKYDTYPGISGYTLQGETIRHHVSTDYSLLQGPSDQSVFLYPIVGSWGFSPNAASWREFLRWYHKASQDVKFKPLVPGLKSSEWYRVFLQTGRTETMWTAWHIYYTTKNHEYTLYPSFPQRKGLAFNWKEPGEHYSSSVRGKGLRANLLEVWPEKDLHLPEKLVIVDTKGKITGQKLTPSGLE